MTTLKISSVEVKLSKMEVESLYERFGIKPDQNKFIFIHVDSFLGINKDLSTKFFNFFPTVPFLAQIIFIDCRNLD